MRASCPPTILLIGNLPADGQHSMLRMAELLAAGLRRRNFQIRFVQPRGFFVRIPAPRFSRKWLAYLDKFLLFPFALQPAAGECQLAHIIDHSNAVYRFYLPRLKTIVTCNDLLAVRSARNEFTESRTGITGKILQRWIMAGLRRSDRLVCISEAVRQDAIRLIGFPPEKVSMIHPGLGERFEAEVTGKPEKKRKPSIGNSPLPARYILHVGGNTWYKNRQGVLFIYQTLRQRLGNEAPALVMVGPVMPSSTRGVLFLNNISDDDLVTLYQNALLLLFPSLAEGFGWPIIEAQACGCPVITTERNPMLEAGGDSALYLKDPGDAVSAVNLIIQVLAWPEKKRRDQRQKGMLNARRFSRESMIDAYANLYGDLLSA